MKVDEVDSFKQARQNIKDTSTNLQSLEDAKTGVESRGKKKKESQEIVLLWSSKSQNLKLDSHGPLSP